MEASVSPGRLSALGDSLLIRVVAFYVLLVSGVGILMRLVPESRRFFNARPPISALMPDQLASAPPGGDAAPGEVVLGALVAVASACLLMLPVTWIYVQTRRKKGFQQSVVQTLIILPLVVAGVILLVQDSVALAFSLGGVVGAVSFRNNLRDTKDAIYIFLAIVIGLAAGVHSLVVAATISVSFNILAALMWWTDFGRTGATLEGGPAERRLRRAKAMANRTGAFVSMIDRELLQSMTPEQLDLLADRARAHQHAAAAEAGIVAMKKGARNRTIRVESTEAAEAARRTVERALESSAKKWELIETAPLPGGRSMLSYEVRLKKNTNAADFIAALRAATGPSVTSVELVDEVIER
ncbi:MAG TPA: DUF4956 domain-containing protein [Gemmatimonadales bacterium]